MVSDVMNMRERTGQIRKDFMQLLIELKEKGHIAVHDAEEEKEIEELNAFSKNLSQTESFGTNLLNCIFLK